jgi:uncharacterized repeat protein (TIGR01451 family)
VYAVTTFTVVDAANPSADVSVSKDLISNTASSGNQVVYSVQVTNFGPSDATSVQLTDTVPANTTFHSFGQLSGPTFTCTSPNEGDTGTTTCTIASLARDETAIFVATYVVGNASNGTVISNTVSASSSTPDPNTDNNSSTAAIEVVNAPCQLSTPDNITQDADSGQAGAVVTYTTPTGTGDCGTDSTGENGETIPAISCNPASGSFFPVGTSTVICSAQTGAAVSFQVTINNPGALSISLNGPSSITIECGVEFADPAASAIDGSGQSVPVTASYTGGFDPNAPAVGSYTATYTATVDPNSVSTTRTITVTDTEGPTITITGANPYRIKTNSCIPFVDPGATALDGCAGPKSVTSSISGPGGATSVNNAVPGTYTVTYTATDGTHQTTATRTVLVGDFTDDDQPPGDAVPPTITLNGDDQIFIECGTPFTDPGATATACGSSVQVTTTGTVDIHQPGVYSITYSATSGGQTATTTRTVTVTADNTAPTIQILGANPMTVECHTTFIDPGATAHDACAGDFAATASGTVNADVVGTYTVTYNATDPSGHAAAPVTRTVNVVDTTAPVVTPPANVTVNTGPGATSCGTTVSDATLGTATANDSCAGPLSVTRTGVPAGNVFPVGTTTITYTANDGYNTGTATQTVTVIDNTAPVISCPASITLEPTCPSGAIATWTPPVGTDNCAGSTTSRTAGPAPGSVFPIGSTTVTYTVTDASGNTASCSFTVTVKTAAQVVQDLITRTQALQPPLTGQQAQGLVSKLNQALTSINNGNYSSACGKLGDYVTQVQSYINNGTLTSAQGTPLITSANKVRNTIGCTNLPCS